MDVYKIGVSMALANGVSPVLAIIGRDILGLHSTVRKIEQNFGGWGRAIAGVGGILAGGAIIKGLAAIAKHGGDVNHQLNLMKGAGMNAAEIQDSVVQAMKTSGNVLTTTLSENLRHIKELRYAFGDTATAMKHLDEVSKANAILNNIKGGGTDQVWELVKALEQKGLTADPKAFSSYVDTMTKVVQATGGKVTPQTFQSTFKYGRTAMLGWDEAFIGGALPRLIQSMMAGGGGSGGSGGPGNALMSAFAKVVQGQMPKKAAEEFDRMGLTPGGISHIKGSSQAQINGDIAGKDLFIANPYEWVQKILMPALAQHGVTSQNDIITQISKMFPVRTAGQIITEMGLQGRFAEGANSPFEKDIKLQKGAVGLPAYDDLIKNDYPMVMEAFNKQLKNLGETLGSPLMAPGGPVIRALASVSGVFNSMSQFAGANPEVIKNVAMVLGAIAGALVVMGGIAIVSLLGLPGLIAGVAAGIAAFAALHWDTIRTSLLSVNAAITDFIAWISSVPGRIAAAVGSLGKLFSNPGNGGGKDLEEANKRYVPMRFNPGATQLKAQPISLSLNVDGRTLAQSISDQLEYLYEHSTGAPSPDGTRRFLGADSGLSGI